MTPRYYLGIDIGTHSSRGILLDEHFGVAADLSCPHGMENPRPGWFEHDAKEVWWHDFCWLAHELVGKAEITSTQIACVGLSALGTDCVPVDEECEPLRPAILYGIDARALEEQDLLTREYGPKRVQELFGHQLSSGDTATKICWIARHEPEVYARTYKFLTGSSFICARLTGAYVIDRSLAEGSYRPIYRMSSGEIDPDECRRYCRPDQVALPMTSTDVVGGITAKAALETGLAQGTPVICGTGDSVAEGVSCGLVSPGTLFVQYGSTLYYYYCIDRPAMGFTSRRGLGTLRGGRVFTVPGTFSLGDGTNAAGTLTEWVRDTFYGEETASEAAGGPSAWDVMQREAAAVPAGSRGLMMLPYIYGERSPLQDPDALGMYFGLRGDHGRAECNRAALEAVGYSTLQHLRLFEEMGLPATHVIVAGGGTRNATWMHIISDMLGLPVHMPHAHACSAYGDALMAAVGVGAIKGFAAIQDIIPEGAVIEPDEENHALYERLFPLFVRLYRDNKQSMHELARTCAAV